jgi:excisionase family DNA binding protein
MDEQVVALLTKLLEGQDQIAARVDRLEGKSPAREEKLWYTPEELAEQLHRKPYTCREWARRGRIRAEKDDYSNRWRIHKDEVQRLRMGGQLLPEREPRLDRGLPA